MKGKNRSTYPHTKIVLAGLLTTKSLVRDTADILYHAKYSSQKERNKAVMGYLHSLGVSSQLVFDDLSNLFEAVFPDKHARKDSTFPIFLSTQSRNVLFPAK